MAPLDWTKSALNSLNSNGTTPRTSQDSAVYPLWDGCISLGVANIQTGCRQRASGPISSLRTYGYAPGHASVMGFDPAPGESLNVPVCPRTCYINSSRQLGNR